MILETLRHAIESWYNTFGYGGIILAMAIESCLIPLPSEIIMPLAGAFVTASFGSKFNLVGVAVSGAIGCVLGSAVAYWIGATGGRPFIMNYGKYILISRHDFDLADRWFVKYGSSITFFSRLLPVVRTYISLPAGISGMNFPKFLTYTFLGSLPWRFVLAYAGVQLGNNFNKVGTVLHGLDFVIVGVLAVLVALYVVRHFRQERAYDAKLQQNKDVTEKMPRVR